MNARYTFLIPAGLVTQARAKCKAAKDDPLINLPGLDGMFLTPVIAAANANSVAAKWFISSGWLSDAEVAYLNAQLPGPFEASDFTVEITLPDGSTQRVEEDAHTMLVRLGLKLKTTPL